MRASSLVDTDETGLLAFPKRRVLCSFGNFKSGDLWLALITFLYVSTSTIPHPNRLLKHCTQHAPPQLKLILRLACQAYNQ